MIESYYYYLDRMDGWMVLSILMYGFIYLVIEMM